MSPYQLKRLTVLACVALAVLPGIACAGDAPLLVVGDWGIGEIDGRIMFYAGRDVFVDTRIPAPPRGPRWNVLYNTCSFVVVGGAAIGLYPRWRRRISRQIDARPVDER